MKRSENRKISVGLMGTSFLCANKGCEALAYSFLDVLGGIAEKEALEINLFIFSTFSYKTYFKWILKREFRTGVIPSIFYKGLSYYLAPENQDVGTWLTKFMIRKCDIVFDFTSGDSFTDLYGKERFHERMRYKKWVLEQNIPLVLGSQTYGPFEDKHVRQAACEIFMRSYEIFSRDVISDECVKKLCGRDVISVTDVAFALPYRKCSCQNTTKIKVGINISGLLWEGGYTRNNQFSLTVDYKEYCYAVIHFLMESPDKYEIYIIPHVFGTAKKGTYVADDDMIPYEILKKKYPEILYSPIFETPMDAKSYISAMDVFIGARMHATIGAFSAGVATIPFSYSRKFEGLYETLGYDFTIRGTKISTKDAVEKTIHYIIHYEELKEKSRNIMNSVVNRKNHIFQKHIGQIVVDIINKKIK